MNNLDVKKAFKALGITTVVILSVFGLFWTIATFPLEFTATIIGILSLYIFYTLWKLIYEDVLQPGVGGAIREGLKNIVNTNTQSRMHNRRNFLKLLSMAAVSTVMPKTELPIVEDKIERLTISSTGYEGIGVERMRITSTGNVILGITEPNTKLKVYA